MQHHASFELQVLEECHFYCYVFCFLNGIFQRSLTFTAAADKLLLHIPCRFVDRFNRLLDHATSSEKPLQVGVCHPLGPLPLFNLYSCTHPVSHRYVGDM